MPATVTAGISSLILTVPDPSRDDLLAVKVWASTTSGFTPAAGNLVYTGKAFVISIANLTPLTTYYLRYAYISEIEPDNYTLSGELSGVPNKIDGGLIVDGSVSASAISATALRGKMLAGNVHIDRGTIASAAVSIPATVNTTTTVSVLDTSDFNTVGAALLFGSSGAPASYFRYTGKTATSLTGVSGLVVPVAAGDTIVPIGFGAYVISEYPDIYASANAIGGADYGYMFRRTGGNAIAISDSTVADTFTYAAGDDTGLPGISGISGLASFPYLLGRRKVIIDDPGFPTTTIATAGAKTSLTINASTNYLNASGGEFMLVSTTVVGIQYVRYTSYSGTTVSLAVHAEGGTVASGIYLTAGTYYLIPLVSNVVIGAHEPPVRIVTNFNRGIWDIVAIGNNSPHSLTSLTNVKIRGASGSVVQRLALDVSSDTSADDTYNAPVARFEHSGRNLPLWLPKFDAVANLAAAPYRQQGEFGLIDYAGDGATIVPAYFDGLENKFIQPLSSQVRFSDYSSSFSGIALNGGVFSFDAGGVSGGGKIALKSATFSDAATTRNGLGFVGLNVNASGNYGFGVTATAGDRINASIATTGVDDVAAYRGTASSTITADSATALSTGVSLTAAFDQNGFNASQAHGSVRGAAYSAVATGASGTVTNAIGSIAFVGNYGAGTVTNAMGYWTLPLNIAGGALTNYYGFRQPPTNQGSGTVIAFYPSIAARTGAWNFYSDGTANNAYLGKSRFGSVVAPVNTVDITGSFGRGAPVTKTANFTLAATENWIICNGSGSITVTLPAASSWTGREVTIKTITAQTVVSAASNVVPLAGGAAGTAILAATAGKWATLVSNGANWVIMAGN